MLVRHRGHQDNCIDGGGDPQGGKTRGPESAPQLVKREHVEDKLQREVASMLLDSSGSLLPPRAAYERLLDLSHALALARHYVRIDLHEALNMTLAREFGAFEMVSPEAAEKAEAAAAAAPATAASRGEVSVRSLGLSAKTAERSACAPRGC